MLKDVELSDVWNFKRFLLNEMWILKIFTLSKILMLMRLIFDETTLIRHAGLIGYELKPKQYEICTQSKLLMKPEPDKLSLETKAI